MSEPTEVETLRNSIAALKKKHETDLLMQARGKKVDAMTALTMRRLERECGFWQAHCARLGGELREAAKFLPESKRSESWISLADAAPKARPTPGKELLAFRSEPLKLSARDLVLAVEDEMKAPCPETLRIVIEQALPTQGEAP